jgi:hypothetical protein
MGITTNGCTATHPFVISKLNTCVSETHGNPPAYTLG